MLKILIIEDEIAINELMSDVLSDIAEIDSAFEAREAEKFLATNKYDLVISDYFLGETNAFAIFKNNPSIPLQIPVILVAAHPSEEVLTIGKSLGITQYLKKPINFNELVPYIQNHIKK